MTQDRDVFRLDGRSALVTGAGGGVGEAIARAFSAAGAAVLVTDIDKDAAVATAESITAAGGTAQPFVLDVRDSAAAKARAIAWPRPLPAPVTSAERSSSRKTSRCCVISSSLAGRARAHLGN